LHAGVFLLDGMAARVGGDQHPAPGPEHLGEQEGVALAEGVDAVDQIGQTEEIVGRVASISLIGPD